MNKRGLSAQRAREKALFRYFNALERGDFETVAAISQQAVIDPILERMMAEVNEVLAGESPPRQQINIVQPRQSRGIKQVITLREPSPDGQTPKTNHHQEEDNTMFTTFDDTIRKGNTRLQFLTAVAAVLILILLGAILLDMASRFAPTQEAIGVPLAFQTAQPELAGCHVTNTADLQSESVRLAGEATTLLEAEVPDTELATLLGICALQMSYSFEADTTLQQSLYQADQLLMVKGHRSTLFGAQYSPDGKYILTNSWDGTARLWDAQTLQEIRRFQQSALVLRARFSPDGRYILTSGNNADPNVRLWDTESGELLATFRGHTATVFSVAFSSDGKYGVSAAFDGTARLWNLETGEASVVFEHPISNLIVQGLAFSPEGQTVITGSSHRDVAGKGLLQEWSVETGEPVRQFIGTTTTNMIWDIQFSPDGRYMVTAGDDGTAIWDYQTGEEIQVYSTANAYRATFSPDGKQILVGDNDSTERTNDLAHLWNVETGELMRVFTINAGSGGGFSPDGRHIVTAYNEETTTLPNDPQANAALYNTDYRDFIAYACEKVTRDFTAEERTQYGISEAAPTCPQFGDNYVLPAGMTPVPTQPIPVWTPLPPLEGAGS